MIKTGMRFGTNRGGERDAETNATEVVTTGAGIAPEVRDLVVRTLYDRMNMDLVAELTHDALVRQIEQGITRIADEQRLKLNDREQHELARQVADDMVGIGPLELLLRDESVTDIIVNGHDKVFVERRGRLAMTDIRFRDEEHLRAIASRIARQIGRRVDESQPMVDARLKDGSRVNIVIPPIALDGTMISIRKFPAQRIGLKSLVQYGSMSEDMRMFFELAARCRFNIVISGGTSSGKTTLLNAISEYIHPQESVVTIEDSAELRLLQPNVRRLETRPATIEGLHEVTMRQLVKNALRMRPDRVILGEVRGAECFDMLQAMNTGHEGSMGTLHANNTRDALARMENMILMAGFELPIKAIRAQIASAVDLIVQAERMVDGVRRVVKVTEIVGMEGETIATQDLFEFEVDDAKSGSIQGRFVKKRVGLANINKMKRYGQHGVARALFSGAD